MSVLWPFQEVYASQVLLSRSSFDLQRKRAKYSQDKLCFRQNTQLSSAAAAMLFSKVVKSCVLVQVLIVRHLTTSQCHSKSTAKWSTTCGTICSSSFSSRLKIRPSSLGLRATSTLWFRLLLTHLGVVSFYFFMSNSTAAFPEGLLLEPYLTDCNCLEQAS